MVFSEWSFEKEYYVGSVYGDIDIEKTRAIYTSLPMPCEHDSAAINFRQNLLMREQDADPYLRQLGMDLFKYQKLSVVSINRPVQTVTYCGCYPICVQNSDSIQEALAVLNETEMELRGNITDFDFEFNFEYIDNQVVLFFWADLPWLFMPPIQKSRYENKVRLPQI